MIKFCVVSPFCFHTNAVFLVISHLFHLVTGIAQLRTCSTLCVLKRNAAADDQPRPNWQERSSGATMAPKKRADQVPEKEPREFCWRPERLKWRNLWKLKASGTKDRLRSCGMAEAHPLKWKFCQAWTFCKRHRATIAQRDPAKNGSSAIYSANRVGLSRTFARALSPTARLARESGVPVRYVGWLGKCHRRAILATPVCRKVAQSRLHSTRREVRVSSSDAPSSHVVILQEPQ